MGFINDHKVGVQIFAPVHGVVQLIAQNFGRADNDGRVQVDLMVPSEKAHTLRTEFLPELKKFGVGQGLEGRGVPSASPLPQNAFHGLFRNKGLARSGGRRYDDIPGPQFLHGLELKRVWRERSLVRPTDFV